MTKAVIQKVHIYMSSLSLEVIPFQAISQEEAEELGQVQLTIIFGYGKKAKKGSFELSVVLEDIPQKQIIVSGENLTSIGIWYNYFLNATGIKSKYILFAKTSLLNIGSGFVSSHLHFASLVVQGVYEFLLIKLNNYVFERLIKGKSMLPTELSHVMTSSINGATTVDNLVTQQRQQENNSFLEMENRVNNLETESVNRHFPNNGEDPLTNITVWKRYSTLLCSINNICFSIDEHFNNISRTTYLNENIVKEVCTDILKKHKDDDSL